MIYVPFLKVIKKVREELVELTYEKHHGRESDISPYICDNLAFDEHRESFKNLSSFCGNSIASDVLGFNVNMKDLNEKDFNKVQNVRLLLLDLLIVAYDDIKDEEDL